MKDTLHDLQLKFIIRDKTAGYIVAAFESPSDCEEYLQILRLRSLPMQVYEVKESY